MESSSQRGGIKELYQMKFIENDQPKGLIQRVLHFQKKLHQYRIDKSFSSRIQGERVPFLIEEGPRQFRPSTNYSVRNKNKAKMTAHHLIVDVDTPAVKQLRATETIQRRDEFTLLSEIQRKRSLYTKQQQRKRSKMSSSRNQSRNGRQKMSPMKLTHEDQENSRFGNYLKAKNSISIHKQAELINTLGETISRPLASKKVFIGGHDLEQAAEQYNLHLKKVNHNVQMLELQQRAQGLMIRSTKTSAEKRKKKPSRKVVFVSVPEKKTKNRTQVARLKQEQEQRNLDLNPWIVDNFD